MEREADHGYIVILRFLSGKMIHCRFYAENERSISDLLIRVKRLHQPVISKTISLCILRIRNSVRIKEETIPGAQTEGMIHLGHEIRILDPAGVEADPDSIPEGALVVLAVKQDAAVSGRYSGILRDSGRTCSVSSEGLYQIWR